MTLMKIYLILLLFLLYDTNEGSLGMSRMNVYLKLLLFVLYVTDEAPLKIITISVVCHW